MTDFHLFNFKFTHFTNYFAGGCIASRFAIMELKTNIFYLLSKFIIERSAKTQHPLMLEKKIGSMNAEKGFWIQISRRKRD